MPLVPTVATEVLPLVQVPPGVPSEREAVAPRQILTGVDGRILTGPFNTFTVALFVQTGVGPKNMV